MIDMRNCIAFLFLIFFVSAYSQEVIKEYQLPDKNSVQDIEMLSISDTLILSMSLDFKGRAQLMTFLIPPDTSLVPFPSLHDANKNLICGIVPLSGGNKMLYYIEQAKKEFRIKAIEVNFEKKLTSDAHGELVFNGRFLAMLTEGNRAVIFSNEKGTIHEITLDGLKVSNRKSYVLPSTMAQVSAREMSLCVEGHYVGVLEAKSHLKLFVNDDWITAVLDYGGYGYTSAYTVIAKYERSSGKVVSRTFPAETETTLSSTILDTIVYRTINSLNVFKIEGFDMKSAKKVYEDKIVLAPTNEKQSVYFREGRANRIGKGQTFKDMVKTSSLCEPFVIAEYKGDSTLITWGTYYDETGTMAPGGTNPFAGMVIMMVGTTIRQTMPGPGVSRYFYLTGSAKDGFDWNDSPDCLRTRIDTFEIEQQKSDLAKKLGYFKFNDAVISVYYLPKKNKLILVKFQA